MKPVCPKCDVALVIVRLDEVEADVCPDCRGCWLDAGELEQLGGLPGAADRVIAPASRYLCPRCDQPLRQVMRAGVELEDCPRGHGVWLDAGELPKLHVPAITRIFTKPNQQG